MSYKDRTHFLSIPITCKSIKDRFNQFKTELMNGNPINGLDDSLFMKVDKLHLTLGMLNYDADLENARKLLDQCRESVVQPILDNHGSSLGFRVAGIATMNEKQLQRTNVMYAKVECEILQQIADKVVEYFCENGLMTKEREHVTLHVTLINSRYRRNPLQQKRYISKRVHRVPFDACPILANFGEFEFGEQMLSEMHISDRTSVNSETGYYNSCGVVCFE